MTPDEIEASLVIPGDLGHAAMATTTTQNERRGSWPSPRDAIQPNPPWPADDSPILRYLLWKAIASIEQGMDLRTALVQLAVHAWFEGGIENYDRARQDANGSSPES